METILDLVSKTIASQNGKQRPKVCLTWAQSLDGRLSITSDVPTLISDRPSLQMTHALRALHDAILVGIGTLISDNPRLTCRMDPDTREVVDKVINASDIDQGSNAAKSCICYDPVPIILDSNSRTPSGARCLHARSDPQSLSPFLFHHSSVTTSPAQDPLTELVQQINVPLAKSHKSSRNHLDLTAVVHELRQRGIKNVMVEGGASVISSFLDIDLWDIVVVAVSPQLFRRGVNLRATDTDFAPTLTQFCNPKWVQLGRDIIFIGFPDNRERALQQRFV